MGTECKFFGRSVDRGTMDKVLGAAHDFGIIDRHFVHPEWHTRLRRYGVSSFGTVSGPALVLAQHYGLFIAQSWTGTLKHDRANSEQLAALTLTASTP